MEQMRGPWTNRHVPSELHACEFKKVAVVFSLTVAKAFLPKGRQPGEGTVKLGVTWKRYYSPELSEMVGQGQKAKVQSGRNKAELRHVKTGYPHIAWRSSRREESSACGHKAAASLVYL